MWTPRAGGPEELREEEYSEINGLTENGEGSEDEGSEPTVHSRRWVHVSGNDEASSSSEEESDNGGQDLSESVRTAICYTIIKSICFSWTRRRFGVEGKQSL